MGENTKKPDLFDRFLAVAGGYFLATRTFHVADEPGLESIPFIDLMKKGSEH